MDTAAEVTADAVGGMIVYPNPATSMVTIELVDPSCLGGILDVYNQLGQRVTTMRITSQAMQLDVSGWGRGIYFIRVSGGKNGETSKLVKI